MQQHDDYYKGNVEGEEISEDNKHMTPGKTKHIVWAIKLFLKKQSNDRHQIRTLVTGGRELRGQGDVGNWNH